ncbi:MAG: phage holin family protein, partial [Luteimonas sp.]|nr:phage holin family protein [Luteimonas sp.]
IVFGASAWLLVMGVLTAPLHSLGLSWLASFAICAALSLGVTGFAAWRVSVFFEYAGMHATRRQLARVGIGDEDADDEDAPATAPQAGTP